MHQVRIDLDAVADAAYITVSDSDVARTKQITDSVLVDLDEYDMVVGIEVLGLDSAIPYDRLVSEVHLHSSVIHVIQLIRPTVGGFVMQATSRPDGYATGRSEPPVLTPS